MNASEAISRIKFMLDVGGSDGFTSADKEALNMAINSLSGETVPLELIDRQALIADYRICGGCSGFENCTGHILMCDTARVRQAINEAPVIELKVQAIESESV